MSIKKTTILVCAAFQLFLSACGGGGGGGGVDGAPQSNNTPSPNTVPDNNIYGSKVISADLTIAALSSYSYINSKAYPAYDVISSIGNYPQNGWIFYTSEPNAWAMGDFMQNGKLTLFTAKIRYSTSDSYDKVILNQNNYAEYQFWELENNKKVKLIATYKSNCLHPRKAVVADFNKDGAADIFISCTGYDAAPMPGEKSEIMLSAGKGTFNVKSVGDAGYKHGASAVDINGDGFIDIVVADQVAANVFNKIKPYVYFMINNGDGTFTEDYTKINDVDLFTYGYGLIYAVEMMDVDSDGTPDIVIGGYDAKNTDGTYSIPTKILYGKDGKFGDRKSVIPLVEEGGSVLDFILHDGFLYVARTDMAYHKNVIQKVNLATFESQIVYSNNPPTSNLPTWVSWWIPTKNGLRAWNTNINNDLVPY